MHKSPRLINTHWLLFFQLSCLTLGVNLLVYIPLQFRALQARGAKAFMPPAVLYLVLLALAFFGVIDILLLGIDLLGLPKGPAIDPLITLSEATFLPVGIVYLLLCIGLSRMLIQVKQQSERASQASDPHLVLLVLFSFFHLQYKINQYRREKIVD